MILNILPAYTKEDLTTTVKISDVICFTYDDTLLGRYIPRILASPDLAVGYRAESWCLTWSLGGC